MGKRLRNPHAFILDSTSAGALSDWTTGNERKMRPALSQIVAVFTNPGVIFGRAIPFRYATSVGSYVLYQCGSLLVAANR